MDYHNIPYEMYNGEGAKTQKLRCFTDITKIANCLKSLLIDYDFSKYGFKQAWWVSMQDPSWTSRPGFMITYKRL